MQSGESQTLEGAPLVEADKGMRKGRSSALYAVVGLGVAMLVGLLVLMGSGDEQRVFRELGKRINGTKQVTFDGFLSCVLAGQDPTGIRNNTELERVLIARAEQHDPHWVQNARDACLPMLVDAEGQLEVLITPKDIKADVQTMAKALADLRTSFAAFVAYLESDSDSYDRARLNTLASQIARPWYSFRKAHSSVNVTIKRKLQ